MVKKLDKEAAVFSRRTFGRRTDAKHAELKEDVIRGLGGASNHIRCLCNVINLAVNAAQVVNSNQINRLRELVSFIRVSPKRLQLIEEKMRGLGGTKTKKRLSY